MISIVSDFSAVNSELKKIEDEKAKLRAETKAEETKSVAELGEMVFGFSWQAPDDYLG